MNKHARLFTGALMLSLVAMASPGSADEGQRQRVAQWLASSLEQELSEGAAANMNKVASALYSLANYWQSSADAAAGLTLQRVAAFLDRLDTESLECGPLADVFLSGAFLRRAGVAVDLPPGVESRMKACTQVSALFDLANMLFFVCHYTDWDAAKLLPGGVEKLTRAQREDGGFVNEQGHPSYYLTSHALVALHYCGGSREVIGRAQAGMAKRLARFRASGFNDGLAESLIFLRWTGGQAPDYAEHLAYVKGRIGADGGVCYSESPGCESDWHATSLVLELLNFEASDGGVAEESGTP